VALTPGQIVERLEQIEADLAVRQSKGETAAENFYRAKRDYELAFAIKFMDATGTATERKQKAIKAMQDDPAHFDLIEHEGAYEGWKAATRTLETRASIGQSLLRAQREQGA
jgi:hypothetical protein